MSRSATSNPRPANVTQASPEPEPTPRRARMKAWWRSGEVYRTPRVVLSTLLWSSLWAALSWSLTVVCVGFVVPMIAAKLLDNSVIAPAVVEGTASFEARVIFWLMPAILATILVAAALLAVLRAWTRLVRRVLARVVGSERTRRGVGEDESPENASLTSLEAKRTKRNKPRTPEPAGA